MRPPIARHHPFVLLLLAALIAACGPIEHPLTDTARPSLVHAPETPPKAIILALHGFNDYRRAFDDFAAFAASRGYHVVAFDQQGFGANRNRGLWPGVEALSADLRRKLAALRDEWPDTPLYVLGESMGAAVAAITLAGEADQPDDRAADGVIMAAPAVWGGTAFNPLYRAVLMTAAWLMPRRLVTGQGLDIQASDNIPALIALGRDPMVIKATRLDAVAGLVRLMDAAWTSAGRRHPPLLVLSGARDEIIPPDAVASFTRRLPAESCHAILYPEGWHLLLRDLQRERAWTDILAWIEGDTPAAARPCGGG